VNRPLPLRKAAFFVHSCNQSPRRTGYGRWKHSEASSPMRQIRPLRSEVDCPIVFSMRLLSEPFRLQLHRVVGEGLFSWLRL
jgi:hypothetical protein